MNQNEGAWTDRRDELLEIVVQRGRARKRRRAVAVTASALAVVLAAAGGVSLATRHTPKLTVSTPRNTTTTVHAAQPKGVLLIGDQVMLGAKAALEQAVPGAQVDAAVSRQFGSAISVLAAAKQRGALPATVVIDLGTNGAGPGDVFDQVTKGLRSVMDLVGPKSTAFFVTVKVPRAWEANVNSGLYSDAGIWPNVHILDWQEFSRSHANWFTADGIHLTPAGQTAYAAFIRDGIRPPVTTFTDPFAGHEIPSSGFAVTDDPKFGADQGPTSFLIDLFDDSGARLGTLPRATIGDDVLNEERHELVVGDSGIHFVPRPFDVAAGLPSGCTPTAKVASLAVALCGPVYAEQILGDRILVNHGSGWSELIAKPPVRAGEELPGHWNWAAPSPDGRWLSAEWSAECESVTGLFISVADGSVHAVTGEAGTAWRSAPESGVIAWARKAYNGYAMAVFGGTTECGTAAPVQRGIYLVSPDTGARQLLLALKPKQGVVAWSSSVDQRTPKDNGAAKGITYAYEHFFDPALAIDQRVAIIQGGEGLRAFIDGSFAAHQAEAADAKIVVDKYGVNGTTATVSFHALYRGQESPVNPGELNGKAVLEGGTWKVTRDTYCSLQANYGAPCPAP